MLSEDKVLGSLIVSFHPAPAALKLTVVDRIGHGGDRRRRDVQRGGQRGREEEADSGPDQSKVRFRVLDFFFLLCRAACKYMCWTNILLRVNPANLQTYKA